MEALRPSRRGGEVAHVQLGNQRRQQFVEDGLVFVLVGVEVGREHEQDLHEGDAAHSPDLPYPGSVRQQLIEDEEAEGVQLRVGRLELGLLLRDTAAAAAGGATGGGCVRRGGRRTARLSAVSLVSRAPTGHGVLDADALHDARPGLGSRPGALILLGGRRPQRAAVHGGGRPFVLVAGGPRAVRELVRRLVRPSSVPDDDGARDDGVILVHGLFRRLRGGRRRRRGHLALDLRRQFWLVVVRVVVVVLRVGHGAPEHPGEPLQRRQVLQVLSQVDQLLQPLLQSEEALLQVVLHLRVALLLLEAERDRQLDHRLVVHVARQRVENVREVGWHRAGFVVGPRGQDQSIEVPGDPAQWNASGSNVDGGASAPLALILARGAENVGKLSLILVWVRVGGSLGRRGHLLRRRGRRRRGPARGRGDEDPAAPDFGPERADERLLGGEAHLRVVRGEEVGVDARREGDELVVDGGEGVQHLDDGLHGGLDVGDAGLSQCPGERVHRLGRQQLPEPL